MQIPTSKSGPSLPYPWPSGLFPRRDPSERRKPPELPAAGLPGSKGIQIVCHDVWSIYRDLFAAGFHVEARQAALGDAGDNQLRQDLIEEVDLLVKPVRKAWKHLNYAFFGGAVRGEFKIEAHYPNSRSDARIFDAEDWRAEIGCEFLLTQDYSTIQLCTMDVPAQVIETFHRIRILPREVSEEENVEVVVSAAWQPGDENYQACVKQFKSHWMVKLYREYKSIFGNIAYREMPTTNRLNIVIKHYTNIDKEKVPNYKLVKRFFHRLACKEAVDDLKMKDTWRKLDRGGCIEAIRRRAKEKDWQFGDEMMTTP